MIDDVERYLRGFHEKIRFPQTSSKEEAVLDLKRAVRGIMEEATEEQQKRMRDFLAAKNDGFEESYEMAIYVSGILRKIEERKSSGVKFDF